MPKAADIFERIIDRMTERPVSESLTDLILFAQLVGDGELERWARIESGGYVTENPEMGEDIIVPEYRTVTGQYHDRFGRPLVIQDPKLLFIQADRLRYPACELEGLNKSKDPLAYSNPVILQGLKKLLGIEVHQFVFSPTAVGGVLNAIRNQILERLKSKHVDMRTESQAEVPTLGTRRTIFVSKSFERRDEDLNGYFEGVLRALNIPFENAQRYEGVPVFEKVEGKLRQHDFLVGIYVKRYEDVKKGRAFTSQWLIREAGFIKAEGKDFIGLVEEGVSDLAGFEAEKELIYFSRGSTEKMLEATLRFLEALVYHGFVRPNT